VVSLAIGIGTDTAVFSFADTLLLRPLTVPRPGDVLTVGSTSPNTIRPVLLSSYQDSSMSGIAARASKASRVQKRRRGVRAGTDASPRLAIGMLVTGNFFQ
jgi:hypothetical protein